MEHQHILDYDQVSRLDEVLTQTVSIDGSGNFPSIQIQPYRFVKLMKEKLSQEGVNLVDVRLNGSTASYVLGGHQAPTYHDLDVIFGVKISENHNELDKMKQAVFDVLLDCLPDNVVKDKLTDATLQNAYVRKMVKVTNEMNCWSLISLCNNHGKNFELKFVYHMRRQFEFSVDSFQIILNSMLDHYQSSCYDMSRNIFPTVIAESVYGVFATAISHLKNHIIATHKPEEIRGGGLFKYCNLLVHGFKPLDIDQPPILERYMCSRFFIDFPDVGSQWQKLQSYLTDHFNGEDFHKLDFLNILYHVIASSTICLMRHERQRTLDLICHLMMELNNCVDLTQGQNTPQVYNGPHAAYPYQYHNDNYHYQHYYQQKQPFLHASMSSNPHYHSTSHSQQIHSMPYSWQANPWVQITC